MNGCAQLFSRGFSFYLRAPGFDKTISSRFSCCHGADDAYARIYGYFKRLRALDVVLGRGPRPESSKDRKEAKRAKATRLAAVHVASESGIPADRGSFGA